MSTPLLAAAQGRAQDGAQDRAQDRAQDALITFDIPARKEAELKDASAEQIKTHLTKHWKKFRSRAPHEITTREIASELVDMADERGPYAANRARSTLQTFFAWLMGEGIVEANPVLATNRQTDEQSRDRVLTDAELVTVWNACAGEADYDRIIRSLILTGQRRDEVGAVARAELDFKKANWSLPSARTKNSLPHEIPLSDAALSILQAAAERPGREERSAIFGESGAGIGFSGWSKAKAALDKRIKDAGKKIAPWRVHDIRRTVSTGMARIGVQPHIIEAVLNHISGFKSGVAGTYNRWQYYDEKRQALDLWAAHVEALLAGKTASNVVPLRA